jgi:alkaline phosphatase
VRKVRRVREGLTRRIFRLVLPWVLVVAGPGEVDAQTRIRIVPTDRVEFAVGQRFDIRVEATAGSEAAGSPAGLQVFVGDVEITDRNILDPGTNGERGAGGAGASDPGLPAHHRAGRAPEHTTNFLVRDHAFEAPGVHVVRARTSDGAEAAVTWRAVEWNVPRDGARRVRNVILLLGDGMSIAHRTAARIVARGVTEGRADGLLAMDTMEITGQVMTFSLNSVITDSAPGMSAYVTGHKSSNNQLGVYPDNTADPFDNPRVEYFGQMLRRLRGQGFNVGLVTTSDVTDATPAGNAVHTASRDAGAGIAAQLFDERHANGVTVLLGGGRRQFVPGSLPGSLRKDERDLLAEFRGAGYHALSTGAEVRDLLESASPPARLLGLFHHAHMPVAFDKVGAGRYSDELVLERHAEWRDQPMLDDLARLALRSLSAHSPGGFYLMIEGASIDKQAHDVDPERTIWDTIEFDNAVQAALDFAARTNSDDDPDNDTLVIVTGDHETGGLAIIGVGNERYEPVRFGESVRDYAAVFRFAPEQLLDFFPNYEPDARGFPRHPDPSRKLLLGWAAGPDRYENWISNRIALPPSVHEDRTRPDGAPVRVAVANPARNGDGPESDNATVEGVRRPGFLVTGSIENGLHACTEAEECPGDISSSAHRIAGHTGSDVLLSASGPGALQFAGTYDNTAVFLKMLNAVAGNYSDRHTARPRDRVDLRRMPND